MTLYDYAAPRASLPRSSSLSPVPSLYSPQDVSVAVAAALSLSSRVPRRAAPRQLQPDYFLPGHRVAASLVLLSAVPSSPLFSPLLLVLVLVVESTSTLGARRTRTRDARVAFVSALLCSLPGMGRVTSKTLSITIIKMPKYLDRLQPT